jgi:YegS/Rv2252/BmrU family lipid kinase
MDAMDSVLRIDSTSGGLSLRRRILVVYNPKAGRFTARRFWRVMRRLSDAQATVTVRETAGRGDAESFAAAASAGEFDVIVAAGGDGTINEVVNGLTGKNLPLAVIPLGTANVLAQEIGLPACSSAITRSILAGEARPIHVGTANGRRFVMMAGVGFDAHVVAAVGPRVKRVLGKAAYAIESFVTMLRFAYPAYRVTIDGENYDAASVIIANGRFYAGRFVCAPRASLSDGRLHVCLFLRTGPWSVVRYGTALLMDRLARLPDVEVVPGSRITVEGGAGEPVQCDGETSLGLPLIASAGDETLRLVMPCPCDGEAAGYSINTVSSRWIGSVSASNPSGTEKWPCGRTNTFSCGNRHRSTSARPPV